MRSRFPFPLFYLLPLAWLWFRLIDHMRVEWAVNPQYAYGGAVPFLCAYLLWRKSETLKSLGQRAGEQQKADPPSSGYGVAESRPAFVGLRRGGQQKAEGRNAEIQGAFSFSAFQLFSVCLLCLLYLPTRLVQEANPEWRLVSWALAFEVIGLTLLSIRLALGARRLAQTAFGICFFLVAVPWPTVIEGP